MIRRLAEVIHWAAFLIALFYVMGVIIFNAEPLLFFVAMVIYLLGWSFRYILTGERSIMFFRVKQNALAERNEKLDGKG